jgi:hypothetical protein
MMRRKRGSPHLAETARERETEIGIAIMTVQRRTAQIDVKGIDETETVIEIGENLVRCFKMIPCKMMRCNLF